MLDADCAANQICSSSSTQRICRCINGLDSCDDLPVCIPKPAVAAAEVPLADCPRCQRCISWVKAWARSDTNVSLRLATEFYSQCTTNFTANDVVKCKGVAGAIAFSYNGNLAKRAGAVCAQLGDCVGDAATSKCNVTATKGLDLCTAEGNAGGTSLDLPSAGASGLEGEC